MKKNLPGSRGKASSARRAAIVIGLLASTLCSALIGDCVATAQGTPESSPSAARSSPPDKTNYRRNPVPEDVAPGGKPAAGPNVVIKPNDAATPASTSKPGGDGDH